MKILLTTDWNDSVINGVITSVLNLKKGLTDRGHEVKILTLSNSIRSHVEGDIHYCGSLWMGYVYPKARGRFTVPIYPKSVSDIIEWHPDVVHTHCELSTFHIAEHIGKVCDVPVVHTYHTVYEYYVRYIMPIPFWGRQMVRRRSRNIAKRTSCIIAPTKKVELILRSYKINSEIAIIPSGIELGSFKIRAKASDKASLRKKLNIPDDHFVLVHVGRIAKEKNIHEIFSLVKRIKDEGMPFSLVVVGDGPYKSRLSVNAREMGIEGNVIFTGMIDPEVVPEYYSMGDLFVCASNSETQGLCYTEALCCGVPLLCKWDPCLDGLLQEGVNGWSYSTEEEFFNKLCLFYELDEDSRREMIRNAELSVEKFSIPNYAKSVESIYLNRIKCYEKAD